MRAEDQKAILAVALHAAFADGAKDDRERDEVRRIADSLASASPAIDLRALYQDVLLNRFGIDQAVAALGDDGIRHYAYEMALCVCEADGQTTAAERRFLDRLKASLGLGKGQAEEIERGVDPIVAAGVAVTAPTPTSNNAELDQSILNYALLNGALELLPQSWASMAIIPLQIKMVYGIGQAHGVTLDQGHVKEFIAAAGVGLTSQYLEQFGRKLLGGLLGKVAGKTAGKIGRAATGMAFSFATTYALGHLAKRYYAGGRQMNGELLRETYQSLLGPARELQTRYLPQIEQKASTLDASQVMAMMRS
ncbi:MAG: YcjF family protein [Betaproteobacteria bacterium]